MANPLFNAIMGGSNAFQNQHGNSTPAQQSTPTATPTGQQMTFQDAMHQLQSNTAQMIRQAGYNVPDDIANNPQAAAMHIIQSGQVRNPLMRMIQPMLNRLMGGR